MKIKRTIAYSCLSLMLFCGINNSHAQGVIADTAGIIIGAIRWDWTGGGTVNEAVEKELVKSS